MTDLLPHISQPITDLDDTASYEMRGWMEGVDRSVGNNTLIYTTVSGPITTDGSMFIRVSAATTITLNPTPLDGERVQVQSDGFFTVTISGSINGGSSVMLTAAYDLLDLKYISELNEWVIQ